MEERRTIEYGGIKIDVTDVEPGQMICGTKDVVFESQPEVNSVQYPGYTIESANRIPDFMSRRDPKIVSVGVYPNGKIFGYSQTVK